MLADKFAVRAAEGDAWIGSSGDYYVPSGEALLHGISLEGVSAAMPGYSVPNALLSHAGAGTRLLVHALSLLAGAALVFALGLLLHCAVCGGAAALLYAWVLPSHLSSDRWLYTLLVLASAVALVTRARAPTLRRSLVLGLCLGISLLTLSPLFLFPPALALYERLRPRKGWARQSAVIALAAFLPLTVWAAMNWRTQHRLVLFEDGRADNNITIGALGFVSTALGPAVVAEGVADGRRLLPWAAEEALRHPLRTLRAYWLRWAYGASSQPLLWCAALAAVWIFRRREGNRQAALLAAYFIGVHCLMPVEERYFEPVLPLLCALAASALTAWLRPQDGRAGERFAAAALGAVLAPVLAVQVYALGLTAAYPGRAARPAGLDKELARRPDDAWLRSRRGERRLRQGDARGAAQDLSRALALDPDPRHLSTRQWYSWARMLLGGRDARSWAGYPLGLGGRTEGLRQFAFRTIYHLEAGRPRDARDSLELMASLSHDRFACPGSDAGRVLPRFDAAVAREDFEAALSYWPAGRRAALRERLSRLFVGRGSDPSRVAGLWLAEAAAARRFGLPWEEVAALGRLERQDLGTAQARAAAHLYHGRGDDQKALEMVRRMAAGAPQDAALLQALGARLRAQGRLDLALSALEQARRLKLEAGRAAIAADLKCGGLERRALSHQDRKEYRQALELLDQAVRECPPQARWHNGRGVLKMLLGRKDEAAREWERAVAMDPAFLPAVLGLGSLYSSDGRRQEALRLYRTALRRSASGGPRHEALRELLRAESRRP